MRFAWLCLLCVISAVSAQAAETLHVALDDYCPYYCKAPSQAQTQLAPQPGFVIEILQYAFGKDPAAIEYHFRPWKRGLQDVRQGKLDALVMVTHSEAPDLIFPQQAQAKSEGCYYTRADNHWHYQGVESLPQVRLTLGNGYDYSEPLNSYLKTAATESNVSYLSGNEVLPRIFKMIELGRAEATMDDSAVADHLLMKSGLNQDIRKAGCSPNTIDFYVGFPPKNPASVARAETLSKAMLELRSSGQLEQILARYAVKDWK